MPKPFWEDGLRFECQKMGCCCRSTGDSYEYVYVARSDRQKIAHYLKIPTRTFTRQFCEKLGDQFHLKDPKSDCLFLGKKGCKIYSVRPLQCRTWPFWRENLKPSIWNGEIRKRCPGVGRGRLYSKKEIEAVLKLE